MVNFRWKVDIFCAKLQLISSLYQIYHILHLLAVSPSSFTTLLHFILLSLGFWSRRYPRSSSLSAAKIRPPLAARFWARLWCSTCPGCGTLQGRWGWGSSHGWSHLYLFLQRLGIRFLEPSAKRPQSLGTALGFLPLRFPKRHAQSWTQLGTCGTKRYPQSSTS